MDVERHNVAPVMCPCALNEKCMCHPFSPAGASWKWSCTMWLLSCQQTPWRPFHISLHQHRYAAFLHLPASTQVCCIPASAPTPAPTQVCLPASTQVCCISAFQHRLRSAVTSDNALISAIYGPCTSAAQCAHTQHPCYLM